MCSQRLGEGAVLDLLVDFAGKVILRLEEGQGLGVGGHRTHDQRRENGRGVSEGEVGSHGEGEGADDQETDRPPDTGLSFVVDDD